ncbi:MAG: 8-oxo-dGTP diphosphatase [Myxococcota bacterium]|nr:8-oxo-dGTP diphosphatase [Myxococcales bacterium]
MSDRRGAPVADFRAIDWTRWQPDEHATLCFVLRGRDVLLIRKKRGLGAGKINGPGGRLEPGETPLACAVRETREELGITPRGVEARGELRFQFTDGYRLHGHVFAARAFDGTPVETAEAAPLWTPVDAMPYEEMWEDDRLWFPHLLAGRWFDGRFLFDSATDAMLHAELDVAEG